MHDHNCYYSQRIRQIVGIMHFSADSPELTLAANCVCVCRRMRVHVWIFPTPRHVGVCTNCCVSPSAKRDLQLPRMLLAFVQCSRAPDVNTLWETHQKCRRSTQNYHNYRQRGFIPFPKKHRSTSNLTPVVRPPIFSFVARSLYIWKTIPVTVSEKNVDPVSHNYEMLTHIYEIVGHIYEIIPHKNEIFSHNNEILAHKYE